MQTIETQTRGDETMTIEIERDEWLYVAIDTAERARAFFGLPPETECRQERTTNGKLVWAVKAPNN